MPSIPVDVLRIILEHVKKLTSMKSQRNLLLLLLYRNIIAFTRGDDLICEIQTRAACTV
jgi:hypothetical protein